MTEPTGEETAMASRPAPTATMTGRARLLAAAHHQPVDATPVWFMRQAGRSLPEYRELRRNYPFLTIAKTPELAVEATLMPVDRLGVDGAVLFADIMLPLEGMGVPFRLEPGVGPVIDEPIRTRADVERLRIADPDEVTGYVMAALRLLRGELGERAAVLGFAGAPFTLACYLVEGRASREYPKTKALMYGDPATWHRLLGTLTEVTIRYLQSQIVAGADVVQLFDSWLGLLSLPAYERFVQPHTARIMGELKGRAPTIHFSTGTSHLLEAIAKTEPDVVSVDWRLPLDTAWARLTAQQGIQGNLDPATLLTSWDVVETEARDVLARAGGRRGHIFNLGHGVHPDTDPAMLKRLVELVHTVPVG